MRKPRVVAPPERIFLVVGDIEEDCEFFDCNEVTWCTEAIYDTAVEYRLVKPSRHKRRAQGKGESR